MRASCGWVRWLRNVPLASVSIHWRSHSKPRAVTRPRDRGMPRADFTGYTNSALTETCVSIRLPQTAPPSKAAVAHASRRAPPQSLPYALPAGRGGGSHANPKEGEEEPPRGERTCAHGDDRDGERECDIRRAAGAGAHPQAPALRPALDGGHRQAHRGRRGREDV